MFRLGQKIHQIDKPDCTDAPARHFRSLASSLDSVNSSSFDDIPERATSVLDLTTDIAWQPPPPSPPPAPAPLTIRTCPLGEPSTVDPSKNFVADVDPWLEDIRDTAFARMDGNALRELYGERLVNVGDLTPFKVELNKALGSLLQLNFEEHGLSIVAEEDEQQTSISVSPASSWIIDGGVTDIDNGGDEVRGAESSKTNNHQADQAANDKLEKAIDAEIDVESIHDLDADCDRGLSVLFPCHIGVDAFYLPLYVAEQRPATSTPPAVVVDDETLSIEEQVSGEIIHFYARSMRRSDNVFVKWDKLFS